MTLAVGPTVSVALVETPSGTGDAPFDTVWLDVTGAAHLAAGDGTGAAARLSGAGPRRVQGGNVSLTAPAIPRRQPPQSPARPGVVWAGLCLGDLRFRALLSLRKG